MSDLQKKKMYLADSMDLKLSGVRFNLSFYVPTLFNTENFYTLPKVWIYGTCMYLRAATFAVCKINRLVFISETWRVYCAVGTGPLNKSDFTLSLKSLNHCVSPSKLM